MTSFFYQRNLLLKLTPIFEQPNVLLVKQLLVAMKITEAAIYWRSLKRPKSKKVGQIHQN